MTINTYNAATRSPYTTNTMNTSYAAGSYATGFGNATGATGTTDAGDFTGPAMDLNLCGGMLGMLGAPARICQCHTATSKSRDLILTLQRATQEGAAQTLDATHRANAIDWQGAAADLFRQRMRECVGTAQYVAHLADQCTSQAINGGA
ncbi:hypothetical protein [Bifidobacterium jacchi]|uniref:Uncharacterized protein n=1 Tax=Bifidobacterium jacchi TaxID=2490545 RepID=A0A5N5RJW0_9BIFI|nr:hypothetical protein [Bifidobacterium jacchi]KAB5607564.1 hypothetical protein EHS19_04440 [Bifidobacterium jacchi]